MNKKIRYRIAVCRNCGKNMKEDETVQGRKMFFCTNKNKRENACSLCLPAYMLDESEISQETFLR